MATRLAQGTLWILIALAAPGCSTVRYLLQATEGQLALINRAKPIPEVIDNPRTPARIRGLLEEVAPIKAFGEAHGLKPTSNYTEYVQLDRPAAVWVVSACEPLEFRSRTWRFPIVGSFPYLGWFKLDQAKEFAKDLEAESLDVDLRGASAYSTLGWFRDAILSSMIPEGEQALGDLANVVIHESVHATVYVDAQAYFNESVASFVADRLTEVYLDARPQAQPASAAQVAGSQPALMLSAYGSRPAAAGAKAISRERLAYLGNELEGEQRRKRLHETYQQLKALYASGRSKEAKLQEKRKVLEDLKKELRFRREINNATLIQYKTYHTGKSDFEDLWRACGSDSRRFMKAVGTLDENAFQKSQQEELAPVLERLARSGCLAE